MNPPLDCPKCTLALREPENALCVGGALHGQTRKIDGTVLRVAFRLPRPLRPADLVIGNAPSPVEFGRATYVLRQLKAGQFVWLLDGEDRL